MTENLIEDYFLDKPISRAIFQEISNFISGLGNFDMSISKQISFGVKRKFLWFWLYNVTQKDPNGTPHLMIRLDEHHEDPHIRQTEQISKNRWNHQIIVSSLEQAQSAWLRKLIQKAYEFASKP
jgi:hypothetical protein